MNTASNVSEKRSLFYDALFNNYNKFKGKLLDKLPNNKNSICITFYNKLAVCL